MVIEPRNSSGHEESPVGYEAPRVEEVLSSEDLQREVHYAGAPVSGGGAGG